MMEDKMELAESEEVQLDRLAAEINTIKAQTLAVVQNATLEIGKRLKLAKGAVGHGNWGRWLAENVDYKERTAQNIISIYERFGDGQQKLFGATADPEQVAKLNRSQMLALMSIKDEEACFSFMVEHKEDLHDMSKRELEAAIKELNEVKAQNTKLAEKEKESSRLLGQSNAKLGEQRTKYEAEIAELTQKLQQVDDSAELKALREKCAELEKDAETAAQYQKLYNDAQATATEAQNKYESQIAKLQQENEAIKNTPLEPTVIEKVPEETQKELEGLKAKIAELERAKPERSKEEKMFAHHFENVRSELTNMTNRLNEIPEQKRLHYKEITISLLKAVVFNLEQS